jgi:hypothetical protein
MHVRRQAWTVVGRVGVRSFVHYSLLGGSRRAQSRPVVEGRRNMGFPLLRCLGWLCAFVGGKHP